jgi:hypothetical protein
MQCLKVKKFRHEIKHYINLSDAMAIKKRLSLIADLDKNAKSDGKYKVRSLYFDTLDDKVLMEKISGINNREKFRIRYYNEDSKFIKLEKKSKVNGFVNKVSTQISKEESEKILLGDISWMKNTQNNLLIEFYAKMKYQQLRPKTIVDYVREAFVYKYGNVRITIDSNIQTGINSKKLFCHNVPVVRINKENIIIFEVKYDEYLPEVIKGLIQVNSTFKTAFSKYMVSRIFN